MRGCGAGIPIQIRPPPFPNTINGPKKYGGKSFDEMVEGSMAMTPDYEVTGVLSPEESEMFRKSLGDSKHSASG